ncbi:M48 family metallopeptidase [Halorussus sp. MSC15.2]|uniref:M48 family metallopeptidase n=1 Tax=Halorussus sp. MSC15.2 TaxID=2283638 RepID=UPI0013CFA030|nr:M48 family metalloprotease [Halorussus sp. MSC15.2]NEU58199.1 M48 family metalloprotease [Halorussus sp. MSC15.2]
MSRHSASNDGPPDNSALTYRIAVTLALVLAADALFVAVVAYLLRPWLLPLLGGRSAAGQSLGGLPVAWVALVAPVTLALAWAQLRYTRREALAAADARPVGESAYPDLHARLRRLAQSADVTPPTLAVAETDAANSFTVGDLRGGTVAVSTGLLDALSDDELDAVLAHELAHLQNRDAAVMTLATFLPALANDEYSLFEEVSGPVRTLALGVALVGGYAVSTALVAAPPFGVESLLAFAGFVAFTVLFGGVALGLLALPVAVLSGRLSRYREFAADRAGALLAGDPAAMAGALETLADDAPSRPTDDARASDGGSPGVRSGVRELCFLPHSIADADEEGDAPLADLPVEVETHPPTEERIARLRDLAAEGPESYR